MKIFLDENQKIGKVQEEIFSSFIEQMGRAVYGGIYEKEHPFANKDGFRQDVINAVKELGVKYVRYPGGNFVSGYRWRDGIGPKKDRPVRLEYAWKEIEPNEVGIDEFMKWCSYTGVKPIMAVNLGTGTPQDAMDLLEYCNYSGGTYLSDLRAKNGSKEPYNIENWCLGNEMDGSWQICAMEKEEYALKALKTARYMRKFDSKLKLTVCGSSYMEMPTFPEWDRTVLEKVYDNVDYISLHQYFKYMGDDDDFFVSPTLMNDYIDVIRSTIKYVKALKRSKRDVFISFDEYNVWPITPRKNDWQVAPPILEVKYTMRDALVLAGAIITLINNCDVVKIACLAQLVNIIAPIFTAEKGAMVKESIFYAFKLFSNNAKGVALKIFTSDEKERESKRGNYKTVACCATENEDTVAVFFSNYGENDSAKITLPNNFYESYEGTIISGELDDANDFKKERVKIEKFEDFKIEKATADIILPAHSIVMIKLKKEISK